MKELKHHKAPSIPRFFETKNPLINFGETLWSIPDFKTKIEGLSIILGKGSFTKVRTCLKNEKNPIQLGGAPLPSRRVNQYEFDLHADRNSGKFTSILGAILKFHIRVWYASPRVVMGKWKVQSADKPSRNIHSGNHYLKS